MKRIIQIRIILPMFLLLAIAGCSKDPEIRTTVHYRFWFSNTQGQKLIPGENVDVLFWFEVLQDEELLLDRVRIHFEVTGGGALTIDDVYIRPGEPAATTWTVGDETYGQVLRAVVHDQSDKEIASSDLLTYVFRDDVWNQVAGSAEVMITDMATDTVNGLTFISTLNKLYRQGIRYYIWEEVTDPLFNNPDTPRSVKSDSNGVLYVSTNGGNIVRSTDHGISWQLCAKPWPERSQYLQIYVSNDNRLWVCTEGVPVRYSDDMGITWHDAGIKMSEHRVGDIYRLNDGSLVMHGLDCCSLARSEDDGQTWTPISTPGYSQKLYVTEDDEIYICCDQGLAVVIYMSSDLGATFEMVKDVTPAFRTSMLNTFLKWKDDYYVTIPGYGIMQSKDLRQYEDFWYNRQIDNLFIDHNGVMMATEWGVNAVLYRRDSGLK